MGAMTEKAVQHFLTSATAEPVYKACTNLTKLGDLYGRDRLENTYGQILIYSTTHFIRNISHLLKNGQDRPAKVAEQDSPTISTLSALERSLLLPEGRRLLMVL